MADDIPNEELFPTLEDIRAAAVRYAEEGYDVHRINLNTKTGLPGKRPTYGRKEDGNTLPHVTHAPADFRPGDNLGAKCGKPSGLLAVGDMDCPEAVQIAPHVMPPTRTIGHHNQPTHYHYTSDVGGKGAWEVKGEGKLVELLSDGQQVVMPPSVWSPEKDGDTRTQDHYRVIHNRPVAKVDPDELKRRLRIVAAGAYLLRYFPPAGVGMLHDISNAVAGIFAHYGHQQGYTEEHAELLENAVWTAAGGDVGTALSNVRTTFAADRPAREGLLLRSHEHDPQAPTPHALPQGFTKNFVNLLEITLERQSTRGGAPQSNAPTHDELRDRWRERCPDVVYGLDEWKRYANGIYVAKDEFEVRQEISEIVEEAKREGIRPTASLLSSVTELARVKVAVASGKWDSDPEVLVCGNGTLHIPTRALRAHDQRDYVTSALPYDYNPDADAEVWRAFIETTLPDAWEFVQEYAGYSLTTDCSHETALWLQGHRGSGKSTVIEGFSAMLGHRAGFLGLGDIERSRFALSELPGKTLVVATEQPSSYLQSTDILDCIISGEPVTVDRKYREPLTVRPHAKILWAMNDLPRVSNTTSGIFRRVKVIKFPNPPTKPNPLLKEVIKTEGAGILNWALDGLDRLRNRGGFLIPTSVQAATDEFQENNDVPGLFVEDHCILGDGHKVQSSVLYERYVEWCKRNGHKASSSTRVADDWERLGFERTTIKGKKYWKGLKVPELSYLDDSYSCAG